MSGPQRFSSLRLYAEMLRRKGLSIADAQRMPSEPEPWFSVLTWNERERASFERWFTAYVKRTLPVGDDRVRKEWSWWYLDTGFHDRDGCPRADHHHDEAREADLPRRQWLPVRAALETLPKDQWPTRGGAKR
jgi:hypothetical protein